MQYIERASIFLVAAFQCLTLVESFSILKCSTSVTIRRTSSFNYEYSSKTLHLAPSDDMNDDPDFQIGREESSETPDSEGLNPKESAIDWDKEWSNVQKDALPSSLESKSRPAFSNRKEVVVKGNKNEGYQFRELDSRGQEIVNDDGFQFDDDKPDRLKDARQQIIEREEQLVDSLPFEQIFSIGLGFIAILLAFMVNVYVSGGISDGKTRFQNVDLPINGVPPAIPMPDNQIFIDEDLVV